MTDSLIPLCVAVCDDASVVDRCCVLIEQYVAGAPASSDQINNALQALVFFRVRLDDLRRALESIRDGNLTPEQARLLK